MRADASTRQPDGAIVYAGVYQNGYLGVARLNGDGTRDLRFAGCCAGYNYFFPPASYISAVKSIAVMADGKLVVTMVIDGKVSFARITPDGFSDTTFGAGTGFVVDPDSATLVVNATLANPDGSLLAFGSVSDPSRYPAPAAAVFRYNADGTRDLGFAGAANGIVADPNYLGAFNAAVRMADGGFAAAGYQFDFGLHLLSIARFGPDAAPATSFGTGGWFVAQRDFNAYIEDAFALAVDGAGNLVAAGRSAQGENTFTPSSYLFVRVSPAGTPVDVVRHRLPLSSSTDWTHAEAKALLPLADGDVALGGIVSDNIFNSGQSFAFLTRVNSGATVVLPRLPGLFVWVESVNALYSFGNDELVYLGTSGDNSPAVRRERRFTDNFDFDTDFSSEDPYDFQPNPFTIAPVVGAAPSSQVTSAPFRISGITQPTLVFVTGGTVSVGCVDPYSADPVLITNGQRACVRLTTGPDAGLTSTATVQVGSQQAVFSVSTVGPPDTTITSSPTGPTGAFAVFFYQGDTASGPITGYECSVDGNPFAACPLNNHVQVGPMPVGTHAFAVRAINAYGADPTPATATWTVVAPPETTITSGPPSLTNATTATFTFESSLPGSLFLCNFNHPNAYEPCTSPRTYPIVQSGANLFRVYSFREGTDPTPAEWTWTVDTTPPETNLTRGTSSTTYRPTATFNVSSSTDANATYQCSLDGGAFLACGAGPTVSVTVAAGNHTLAVRAVDAAGNVDPTPDSKSWTYLDTPLETSITSGPNGTIASTSATFAYSSTQSFSTFGCSLTGPGASGATATCPAAGRTYTGLADGTWTFRVWAISEGVTDPTPAERTWIVDTVAPLVAVTAPQGAVNTRSASIVFSANESGVTFACSLDGAVEAACTSPLDLSNLVDGSHSISVAGRDLASNRGVTQKSWTVDATGPDTTLTGGPTGAVAVTSAQFTFTSNEAGSSFQCRLDGAAYATCTSPASFSGLADDAHTFDVRATDGAGNVDPSPATASWSVDTSAPDSIVDTGPSGTVGVSTATFTFHASEAGTTFECSLDSAAYASCVSGVSYSGLGGGMHLFEVRARDALGNADATPASRTWSVDLTAPGTTITTGPAAIGTSTSATFAFTSTEAGTFRCALDGAAYSACTTPVTYGPMSSASHTFAVYAVDAVGNADATPATWSWVVDTQAPETTITSGPPAASNLTSATFAFTASEGGSTFQCSLDGGAFAACTSPKTYPGLSAATHNFQVRATDSLGNLDATPASSTWTIDVTAPDTTITSGPSGNNNASTATFAFTATQSGSTFQCKLDAAAFVACTTPATYTGLARGSHSFQVRAIDPAGNVDASPATRSWSVK